MKSMNVDPNLTATILAPVVVAIITYLVTRLSKGHDARAEAETALFNSGPKIIEQQGKRIESLVDEIGRLWALIHAANTENITLRAQLRELESEIRRLRDPQGGWRDGDE